MPRIICPKCDVALEKEGDFEAHMESEHPLHRASLGFGHTLQP